MNLSRSSLNDKGQSSESVQPEEGSAEDITGSEANGDDAEDEHDAENAEPSDKAVDRHTGPKITLQSFENNMSFNDDRIHDNAPTLVTRIKGKAGSRHVSGQEGSPHVNTEEEEEDVVRESHSLQQSCSVYNDLVVQDSCQQRLDDLELDFGRSGLALEAIAYRVYGSFDQRRGLAVVGSRLGRHGEVGVADELADTVERGDGHGDVGSLGGKLEGFKEDLGVDARRVALVLDGRQGGIGAVAQFLVLPGIFGSCDCLERGDDEDEGAFCGWSRGRSGCRGLRVGSRAVLDRQAVVEDLLG